MVIRIATFENSPATHDDEAVMVELRAWMKSQPGFRAAWHARDSKSGKVVSISVWEDLDAVLAMKDRKFPGGPLGFKPDRVELFDHVEPF